MFSCTGAHVPGDYATIQSALDALKQQQGPGTICLGAQTYVEDISPGPVEGAKITIVGVSAETTHLKGSIDAIGDFAIKGVTVENAGSSVIYNTSYLVSASFTASRLEVGVSFETSGTVAFDGVDFAVPGSGSMVRVSGFGGVGGVNSAAALVVENSYFHGGGGTCLDVEGTGNDGFASVKVVNDTFDGCTTATLVQTDQPILVANNIYAHSASVALDLVQATGTFENNAFFGNTTNYGGGAADAQGYVKADCLLDSNTPPGLGDGSPCRKSGKSQDAPPNDYFAAARGSAPDIGAVQSSP